MNELVMEKCHFSFLQRGKNNLSRAQESGNHPRFHHPGMYYRWQVSIGKYTPYHMSSWENKLKQKMRGIPCDPVVGTWHFHCGNQGLIPNW